MAVEIDKSTTPEPRRQKRPSAAVVPQSGLYTTLPSGSAEPGAADDSSAFSAVGTPEPSADRLRALRSENEAAFLAHLREGEFEYGFKSAADTFFERFLAEDSLVAVTWASCIFHDHFGEPAVAMAIMQVLAHLRYEQVRPHGPLMALAATRHASHEVQECGIRAFENWGDLASLRFLEQTAFAEPWLQDYADQVRTDLRAAIAPNHAG